ncbi:hypothetical protein PAPHI01_2365 [Pancytospora philotis]|nr:hypothetical protein PAPHI01_2365 [Pancytospora philotis]
MLAQLLYLLTVGARTASHEDDDRKLLTIPRENILVSGPRAARCFENHETLEKCLRDEAVAADKVEMVAAGRDRDESTTLARIPETAGAAKPGHAAKRNRPRYREESSEAASESRPSRKRREESTSLTSFNELVEAAEPMRSTKRKRLHGRSEDRPKHRRAERERDSRDATDDSSYSAERQRDSAAVYRHPRRHDEDPSGNASNRPISGMYPQGAAPPGWASPSPATPSAVPTTQASSNAAAAPPPASAPQSQPQAPAVAAPSAAQSLSQAPAVAVSPAEPSPAQTPATAVASAPKSTPSTQQPTRYVLCGCTDVNGVETCNCEPTKEKGAASKPAQVGPTVSASVG